MAKKFLSQALRLTPFVSSSLNLININAGAGKSRYACVKLFEELKNRIDGKAFILISPLKIISNQLVNNYELDALSSIDLAGLGFLNFDSGEIENLRDKKLVGTFQKFIRVINEKPELLEQIGAIIIDEVDSCLFDLPLWEGKNSSLQEKIYNLLNETLKRKIFMIGMSATRVGDIPEKYIGVSCNFVKFESDVIQIENHYTKKPFFSHYKNELFRLAAAEGKIAFFTPRVMDILWAKTFFESRGKKVGVIVSQSANNYKLSDYDQKNIKSLEKTGKVLSDCDVLLFNASALRGLSILDDGFRYLVINSNDHTTQIQAQARFREGGVVVSFKEGGVLEPIWEGKKNKNRDFLFNRKKYVSCYSSLVAFAATWREGDLKTLPEKKEWLETLELYENNQNQTKRMGVRKKVELLRKAGFVMNKKNRKGVSVWCLENTTEGRALPSKKKNRPKPTILKKRRV